MGETRILRAARARHRTTLRSIAHELLTQREDAGLSQAAVARAAGLSASYLSEIEASACRPSLETLHALAAVLGCDLSVRLYPNGGPAIRDRFQARIVEALLRILDRRWRPRLEVPVDRPVRGVIDLVLEDLAAGTIVAVEVHSDLRRVEQQLRWAHQKADALHEAVARHEAPAGRNGTPAATVDHEVSRLLVLRSTHRTRSLVDELSATFATEFPADPGAALAALTTPDRPWPGPSLLFASVHGSRTSVFARTPRTKVPARGGTLSTPSNTPRAGDAAP